MELGVQVCLLAYRLFGGSVSNGMPGDPANMFTYMGPKSITVGVKGVLRLSGNSLIGSHGSQEHHGGC